MLELSVASVQIDSPFVRYPEKDGYQRRLASLITEVCQRPEVPTVLSPALLTFPEQFVYLYYVANHPSWALEVFFESGVCDR